MQTLISGSYSAFADGFNGAGVYLISGIYASSTFERPIYYGSAEDLKRRFNGHFAKLNRGEHHNPPIQNYFQKHGINSLVVFLVESCEPENVLEREQYYLDTEQPFVSLFRGFNISHNASSPMKGRKATEETKAKQRAALKGNPKVAENCRKQAEAKAKTYHFLSPDGKPVTVNNLSAFCRSNNLPLTGMIKIHKGRGVTCKGWRKA